MSNYYLRLHTCALSVEEHNTFKNVLYITVKTVKYEKVQFVIKAIIAGGCI